MADEEKQPGENAAAAAANGPAKKKPPARKATSDDHDKDARELSREGPTSVPIEERLAPDMNVPRDDETVEISLKQPLRFAVKGHDVRAYPAGPCSVHPEAAEYATAEDLVGPAEKPAAAE